MSIMASANPKREPIPEGIYPAVCTRVIDLGVQQNKMFGNTAHKVLFCYEIPDCTIEIDGKQMPKMVSKEFTVSLGEKSSLRPWLTSWRGKGFTEAELEGFDLKNVLGAPCQLQVVHNEKGYENLSIMALGKGQPRPTPATELIYFDLSVPDCMELIKKLPEWVQERIKLSPNYRYYLENVVGEQTQPEFEDIDMDENDLPF